MHNVFVSMPMSGVSASRLSHRYRNARIRAVKAILKLHPDWGEEDIRVWSLLPKEEVDRAASDPDMRSVPLWCLGNSLQSLAGSDVAYFCKGWESARGCRMERAAAEAYGIPMIYEQDTPGLI